MEGLVPFVPAKGESTREIRFLSCAHDFKDRPTFADNFDDLIDLLLTNSV